LGSTVMETCLICIEILGLICLIGSHRQGPLLLEYFPFDVGRLVSLFFKSLFINRHFRR
jgi:hypothetical protein